MLRQTMATTKSQFAGEMTSTYPQQTGGHECKGFDPEGVSVDVG
jgi:hypothetical protein